MSKSRSSIVSPPQASDQKINSNTSMDFVVLWCHIFGYVIHYVTLYASLSNLLSFQISNVKSGKVNVPRKYLEDLCYLRVTFFLLLNFHWNFLSKNIPILDMLGIESTVVEELKSIKSKFWTLKLHISILCPKTRNIF